MSSSDSPKPKGASQLPSVMMSPMAIQKSNEAKIVSLAKAIKILATPAADSKEKTANEITVTKITRNYKEIIELAKKSSALDGIVLNEVLMCGNAIRIHDSVLAGKMSFLAQAAKKLVEERTMSTDDTPKTESDLSGGSPHNAPALMVSQIPRESSSKHTKLNKLTQDGLPPLQTFNKPEYFDGSQHSVDFGFFDMSVHDRTGLPAWTGVTPENDPNNLPKPPMKLHYSVSQLNVGNGQ